MVEFDTENMRGQRNPVILSDTAGQPDRCLCSEGSAWQWLAKDAPRGAVSFGQPFFSLSCRVSSALAAMQQRERRPISFRFFMPDRIFAIIPAGGVGQRALAPGRSQPKQYCLINGKTMLEHAVAALLREPRIDSVHIGVAADDPLIGDLVLGPKVHIHRVAGVTRALTVANTLRSALTTAGDADWALVHDAARPGLRGESLAELVDTCLASGQGGLLALPVPDTVKKAVAGQSPARVSETVAREGLWLAQTPQMFPASALLAALQSGFECGLEITDESSAMEAMGYASLLIKGSAENMKVTWPADFAMMEKWL